MNYLKFLIQNWRFLSFGVFANFFASSGQTYFISVFGGEFRRDFNLSDGDFGFIYMVATIGSAISLIWLGRFIDRIDLKAYTALICVAMIAAVFFTAQINSVLMLGLAIYFLRLMGQGLMNHIAITSMGRYFTERRGTAISMITLGSTAGLAVYPIVGVALIGWLGWRDSWNGLGFIYLVILIPMLLWLLKGQSTRHENYLAEKQTASEVTGHINDDYSVHAMLTEIRFYLMIPAVVAPSFLLTGMIFHQVKIVEIKGWSLSIFASGFIGLAAASFLTSLLLGPLVDRWRAINLLPFILFPLAAGLLILNVFDNEIFGFIYLIFLGISFGATFTVAGAIWPELYGTTFLGSIKSSTKALNVLASALSPWVFGILFDVGFGIVEISWLSVSIILIAAILAKTSQMIHRP